MNTSARGGRKPSGGGVPPGTFKPALPTDSQEVLRLFALAARAVCAVPSQLEQINQRLDTVARRLVSPEANAAQECQRLWKLFARVAQAPKQTLRLEAGKAFCRDLDSLGQRLDLPPLDDWETLPEGIEHAGAVEPDPTTDELPQMLTLIEVRARARLAAQGQSARVSLPARDTAQLVASLSNDDRRQLFEQLVGKGLLGRSEINLLIRFLVKGDGVGQNDTVLIEVLERLGGYLAA